MQIIDVADLLTYLGKGDTATSLDLQRAELLVPLADAQVKNYLKYNVMQDTYTHFLPDQPLYGQATEYVDVVNNRINIDGWSGTQILQLPEIPIRSITAIYSDMAAQGGQGPSDFSANTLLQQGTDFYVDNDASGVCWSGHIRRYYNNWPSRARSVKAIYVAGFTADEMDGKTQIGRRNPGNIKLATILTAAALFHQAEVYEAGAVISGEKLGDYQVSYEGTAANFFAGMAPVPIPPAAAAYLQPFVKMA